MKVVDDIRNTFIDMINQSVWMDPISKNRTMEKVNYRIISFTIAKIYILLQAQDIIGNVGYPDYLDGDNMTELDGIYTEVCYKSFALLIIQLPYCIIFNIA